MKAAAQTSLWDRRASCSLLDGLAAASLPAIRQAKTPRCPTGKMPVLRYDYADEDRISWNLARIRRHIFLALRTR
jgi:hypothetical protein